MRWAVILAGGSGSRFWPLSTPATPKQLLPLRGDTSTAAQTSARLAGLIPPERQLVVTNQGLAGPLREVFNLLPENVLVEPRAASTGPALVWATHVARHRDPAAEILSLHADWVVREEAAFRHAADQALQAAMRHRDRTPATATSSRVISSTRVRARWPASPKSRMPVRRST
jgi:mannose-1-phosphate guanylyltransferase